MNEMLTSPGGTRAVLEQSGIRPRKKYGQNFLIDASVTERIAEAAGVTPQDHVLEIGPGIGTMTRLLSKRAGHVTAVEIDRSLERVLSRTLEGCANVTVIYQDILKTDLHRLVEDNGGRRLKCVANLPYYITTPILLQLLQESECFRSITVMIQKEVADRAMATERDKEYGALSLAVQYYACPQLVCTVPPESFYPKPGVASAVLTLRVRKEPPVSTDERRLFAIIRAAFNQRRKTLANALSHGLQGGEYAVSRECVQAILREMGLPEDIRGEKLSLERFAELTQRLGADCGPTRNNSGCG